MSQPQSPKPAKLIIGVILQDRELLAEVARIFECRFGAIDMISPWYDFSFTDYYAPEMGTSLHRRLLVFQRLIGQQALADIKRYTNTVEQDFAVHSKRRVNIDPGYLLYERFVLASGKNFSHRIYIGRGIYADLTLVFRKGGYQTLDWTYPDYKDQFMRDFLLGVRKKYATDLASGHNAKGLSI